MITKELVAASTVPLVLSVLSEGESYGYALIQRVRYQRQSNGRVAVAHSSFSGFTVDFAPANSLFQRAA
jgi:hypothetical protein